MSLVIPTKKEVRRLTEAVEDIRDFLGARPYAYFSAVSSQGITIKGEITMAELRESKKEKMLGPALSIHQRRTRFVREYLLDHNATQAAIRAGYSKRSAEVTGSRLLSDVRIRAAIEDKSNAINAKLDITVERVKEELARLAFYDPAAYWNPDGSAKPFSQLDEGARRAVAGFEMAELFTGTGEERNLAGYVKKFRLADKGANLERLGRHLQMFPTKVDVTATMEVRQVADSDLNERIAQLERDLGLARAIDDAGRVGIAAAGTGPKNGKAKVSDVLS